MMKKWFKNKQNDLCFGLPTVLYHGYQVTGNLTGELLEFLEIKRKNLLLNIRRRNNR